ncbi:MAG: EAL domain-containing protein [Rhodobacteraceae bacterium]|jgi:EAL domain-containing protein (putative c-di-GMP-specific phosphodiesterase class I)|nr:EAL domain-containing protein [Paracoccaceae bacterium]
MGATGNGAWPEKASPLAVAISAADSDTINMVKMALKERRLALAFQPVVMASNPDRTGFHEGLMRVLDPTGRAIPAKDFMPAVEAHEIGRQIDAAALAIGLRALADTPDLRLSVNMSARSIGHPDWMRVLTKGLNASPTVGERLILEITESSAMMVPELVIRFMHDLSRKGIAFAIDDFGAGQTSFRYLRDFNFDMLKIDGQFTRGIAGDADNRALVQALIMVGKHFQMLTVAEMVETADEAECLRALGVDCLQGFAFGAPTVKPAFLDQPRRRA